MNTRGIGVYGIGGWCAPCQVLWGATGRAGGRRLAKQSPRHFPGWVMLSGAAPERLPPTPPHPQTTRSAPSLHSWGSAPTSPWCAPACSAGTDGRRLLPVSAIAPGSAGASSSPFRRLALCYPLALAGPCRSCPPNPTCLRPLTRTGRCLPVAADRLAGQARHSPEQVHAHLPQGGPAPCGGLLVGHHVRWR